MMYKKEGDYMEISISGYKNTKYNRVATNDKSVAEAIYSLNKYTATFITEENEDSKEKIYIVDWRV